MNKIVIITDSWYPLINGVVQTLDNLKIELIKMGYDVEIISPQTKGIKTIPCPTYPEIKLVINPWIILKKLNQQDTHYHIATEGPLGLLARLKLKNKATTSYHTMFAEYIKIRFKIPLRWTYKFLRWFHNNNTPTLVTTPQVSDFLSGKGFNNLKVWMRGVNTTLFNPDKRTNPESKIVYVGRVSVEKNIEAFLNLPPHYKKVVVGDGPQRKSLEKKYPDVDFIGYRKGEELAKCFANSDAFVFPSLTDTFGIVQLESMACGTPVASYRDTLSSVVIENGINGWKDDDLEIAIRKAIKVNRNSTRSYAERHSWEEFTKRFLSFINHK